MENKVGIEYMPKPCGSEPYNEEVEALFDELWDALDEEEEKELAAKATEEAKVQEEEKEFQALLKEEGTSEEEVRVEVLELVKKDFSTQSLDSCCFPAKVAVIKKSSCHSYMTVSFSTAGINAALGIVLEPGKTYTELASDETLKKLFLKIGYSGPILEEGTTKWYPSGEMDMKYLRKEWSMVFDAMVKVFSTKTTGWNGIPTYIKKLTHSLVHGYKVDVGKLLMAHLKAAIGKKVHIYPHFLMLCINSLCDFDENAPRLEVCHVLKRNTHTTLTSLNLNAHIPLCFTKHMVDQVTDLDFPLPSGFDTFTIENEAGLDPNSANPHSTPYIQPRFSRLPKVQRQALQETRKRPIETDASGSAENQEGVPAPGAANKEGSQTEPTVVPPEPKKKRAKRTKVTVSHPAVSQKTVEENRELTPP
ncbi:hypothetical protein POM88_039544 [Heracleum sosnowskyi]|uniref:Uncharacterized protein n=1 Tax=Heracleum sosnowskyi TaxID=360622 RepID=A0AAD8HCD7_9APIA|nr:hypothetical protein POM88_039544 [Heracleum sosnowskyi]